MSVSYYIGETKTEGKREMNEGKGKTRDLSVAEYFLQVQREYLMADFRRRIYFSPKNKAYYTRVCGYKRQRIETIAERNGLNSIFNSREKMAERRAELFDHLGKPRFELTADDLTNYYSVGNEFQYRGEIYILDQVSEAEGEDGLLTLYSPSRQERIRVGREDVVRIL